MEKRKVASLTPYYKKDGIYYFFLQMRDGNATHSPNRFGLFGGGLEGDESPVEAIIREIKEELAIDIAAPVFFCHFEFVNQIQDSYYMEVEEDFSDKVTVLEGEYGAFLSEEDILSDKRVVPEARLVVLSLLNLLRRE